MVPLSPLKIKTKRKCPPEDIIVDAANAEAMVSLSPLKSKRKRPPEDSNTDMMDLRKQPRKYPPEDSNTCTMDLRRQSRKRPPEDSNTWSVVDLRTQSMKDARGIKKARSDALKEAVLSRPAENPIVLSRPVENPISPPTTPPNDSVAGRLKSAEGTNISNRWLELYKEQDGPERPVSLTEIKEAKLRAMFPIMHNINNKDITDDDNWAPCILIKVRKDQYKVLDVNGDLKVDEDIEWEGDDGLSSTWTMDHKYPSTMFVDSFCTRLEMAAEETEAHAVSPRRHNLRNRAPWL